MDFDQICLSELFLHEVDSKLNKNRPVKFASISKNSKVWKMIGNKDYLSGRCDMC